MVSCANTQVHMSVYSMHMAYDLISHWVNQIFLNPTILLMPREDGAHAVVGSPHKYGGKKKMVYPSMYSLKNSEVNRNIDHLVVYINIDETYFAVTSFLW